jgi:hypothetical protein
MLYQLSYASPTTLPPSRKQMPKRAASRRGYENRAYHSEHPAAIAGEAVVCEQRPESGRSVSLGILCMEAPPAECYDSFVLGGLSGLSEPPAAAFAVPIGVRLISPSCEGAPRRPSSPL